jgi:hypothetical protein
MEYFQALFLLGNTQITGSSINDSRIPRARGPPRGLKLGPIAPCRGRTFRRVDRGRPRDQRSRQLCGTSATSAASPSGVLSRGELRCHGLTNPHGPQFTDMRFYMCSLPTDPGGACQCGRSIAVSACNGGHRAYVADGEIEMAGHGRLQAVAEPDAGSHGWPRFATRATPCPCLTVS